VSVTWAIRPPHPVLRPLVSRYIGYKQDDVTLPVHRGLPSRHVTLIISLQDPVRMLSSPGAVSMQGLVGGLHTEPVLISQGRTQGGIHLELHPFGVHTLFGVSAAALSGHVVGLDQLGRPELVELPDRLASAPDWPERFNILDDVLAAKVTEPLPVAAELSEAWRLMLGSGGRARVADLAHEIGWSRRYFGERLRTEIGLTPKQAARILRFERAGTLMRRGHLDLAGLAIECGYYDQAHLSNEWRTLAGCSPRTWIVEELPFLQDDGVSPVKTECHD
jgi:AraC-like DNA-binding protein